MHEMNNHEKYTTKHTNRARWILIFLLAAIAAAGIGWMIGNAVNAGAEDSLAKCWILCKPGDYVNVRRTPSKNAMPVGSLECGDWFLTDGRSADGWIRCYGIGEYGEGWIWCGYVAETEPEIVMETYACVAPGRVACRKWMGGPKTSNPWMKNGSIVTVYAIAGEWACTARGFVRAEYLEVSPQ